MELLATEILKRRDWKIFLQWIKNFEINAQYHAEDFPNRGYGKWDWLFRMYTKKMPNNMLKNVQLVNIEKMKLNVASVHEMLSKFTYNFTYEVFFLPG